VSEGPITDHSAFFVQQIYTQAGLHPEGTDEGYFPVRNAAPQAGRLFLELELRSFPANRMRTGFKTLCELADGAAWNTVLHVALESGRKQTSRSDTLRARSNLDAGLLGFSTQIKKKNHALANTALCIY